MISENALRQGVHLLLGKLHLYIAGVGTLSMEEEDLIAELIAFHEKQVEANGGKLIEFDGRRQSISAWAREFGVDRQSLLNRLNRGWTVERALTTPFGSYRRES